MDMSVKVKEAKTKLEELKALGDPYALLAIAEAEKALWEARTEEWAALLPQDEAEALNEAMKYYIKREIGRKLKEAATTLRLWRREKDWQG